MNKYLNQRGYALLIVMLTIIIFLSLSAVFISGFLNHVTQEKTVDMNNQAVVAAEMGTKYYSTYFQNELEKIEQEVMLTIINPRLKELKVCEKNKVNKCNSDKKLTDELKIINDDSIKEFNNKVNVLIANFNNRLVPLEINAETVFLPTQIQPSIVSSNTQFNELSYSVIGKSGNETKEKTLNTTLNINIPAYVPTLLLETPANNSVDNVNVIKPSNLQNCLPAKNLSIPYECDLGNSKLVDLINELNVNLIDKNEVTVWTSQLNNTVCPLNVCIPDLKGLTLKSNVMQDFDLSNKSTSNGNIVFPGNMKLVSVSNHLNLDLIVESLSVKNVLQHVSKDIVILGNKAGTGFFEVEGKKKDINVSMESGYKLCLNLDGLDDDSTNIKLTGAHRGELIYFSTKHESISGGIKHSGTYYEFLKRCTIDIDPIQDPLKSPNANAVNFNFEVTVDYFN